MIDQNTIQRIFDATDIVDVISDFVNLKKAGQNYRGYSPFTTEKTPSFFVSPSKGIFKCFSSNIGGNAVKFLMEHEKLTYPEALKFLAKKYNIEVVEKEKTADEIKEQNERESLLKVTAFAQKYFSRQLLEEEEGRSVGLSYFKERGFRENTIKSFQLGYSPEKRNALTEAANKQGYQTEYLLTTGLSIQKAGSPFDRFSGRVIFPIHSLSGQVIGFGGRILKNDAKAAKYLNSPESTIYHKSQVLYGIYFAKKSIVQQNNCFLVEGYTDVLSMHQNGIENVVASSGTALTAEQIRLIKRFTPNVTIIYDGDNAGIKASLRGIDLVLEQGMNVKVVLLPEGEDPDSFAQQKGQENMLAYIAENERDFIRFKTNLLMKEAQNDPIKRSALIHEIVRSIAVIPEGITRSVYIRECAVNMDIQEQVLYAEVNKIRQEKAEKQAKQKQYNNRPAVNINATNSTLSKPASEVVDAASESINIYEKEVMRLLLVFGNYTLFEDQNEHTSVAEFIIREMQKDELTFSNEIYQLMFNTITEMVEQKRFDTNTFNTYPDERVNETMVNLISQMYDLSRIWKKNENFLETEDMKLKETVPESIIALKKDRINAMIKENENKLLLAQQQNNVEMLNAAVQRHQVLNQVRIELYRELGIVM